MYFSVCCSCDTYLREPLIQKPIKASLGNFASFSGRIASWVCQSLSCFTRDSQESLLVAIYNQIKSRNSQNLVVYYSHFKVKLISFLSLHTARKVYKTLWTSLTSFHFAKTFAENLFNALFIPLNWNLLKFKRVICLWKSAALLPIISLDKLELWRTSLSWRRNNVKKMFIKICIKWLC